VSRLSLCVVRALSAQRSAGIRDGVRLFAIDLDTRRIVALLPVHYVRLVPYADVLASLERTAKAAQLKGAAPMPPFVAAAMATRRQT